MHTLPHRMARNPAFCEGTCIGIVLFSLLSTADAVAADRVSLRGAATGVVPDFDPSETHAHTASAAPVAAGSSNPSPMNFDWPSAFESPSARESLSAPLSASAPASVGSPESVTYSEKDFRPRGRSILDADPHDGEDANLPVQGDPAWQRFKDFRAYGRVRLLTLWESSGSIFSLQAGKRGGPSLQWTSRRMSRGEANRGLLDHLLAASIARAGNSLRGMSRPPVGQAMREPAKPAAVSAVK